MPASWTPGDERIVLWACASDSWEGIDVAPGRDALATWTGLYPSSVAEILGRLLRPNAVRDQLLVDTGTSRKRRKVYAFNYAARGRGRAPLVPDVDWKAAHIEGDEWSGSGPASQDHIPQRAPVERSGSGPAVVRDDRTASGPGPQDQTLNPPHPFPAHRTNADAGGSARVPPTPAFREAREQLAARLHTREPS